MNLEFNNETQYNVETYVPTLKRAIEKVLETENIHVDGEVSLTFVSNEKIKELNRQYRNKNLVTDVLSFPQYEHKEALMKDPYAYVGDIVIALERAEEQALEFGHSFEREVVYLLVHSMLHLIGYDHLEEHGKNQMRAKEKFIMAELEIFKSKE